MAKQLKQWQGWILFGGSMAVVFILGLLVSSLMERRAEVASVFNNKRTVFEDEIIAQNEKFKADYPREYETWAMTEDTTFKSKYNSSQEVDVLEQRPEMVVLWAGYAFSRHYNTPRGHKHALEDMRKILRTGNPGIMVKTADGSDSIAVDMQPATCWTCKGPDVPRMMRELGNGKDQFDPANFYAKKWSELGAEEVNTIGCSDCHDARTMDLRPARPALYEAFARRGLDVKNATHQEMRSLVCAQCHVEYYFIKPNDEKNPGKANYLVFPHDKGLTCEAAEEYYDEIGFYDYIHPLSGTKILKAQHPGWEMSQHGIHAQRGVSCADSVRMPRCCARMCTTVRRSATRCATVPSRNWPVPISRLSSSSTRELQRLRWLLSRLCCARASGVGTMPSPLMVLLSMRLRKLPVCSPTLSTMPSRPVCSSPA